MARVYVTQQTHHSTLKAEQFGEVVYLSAFNKGQPPAAGYGDDFVNIRNSPHNERLLEHLAERLRDFDPAEDFIIPIGSPYVQVAVFWILGHMGIYDINILRWDNRDHGYIPLPLKLRRGIVIKV